MPLLFVFALLSEAFQRSVETAAAAIAVTVAGDAAGGGGGVVGGAGAFGGGGGEAGLGRVLEMAGDVWDTLFVIGSVWYMLRFFR